MAPASTGAVDALVGLSLGLGVEEEEGVEVLVTVGEVKVEEEGGTTVVEVVGSGIALVVGSGIGVVVGSGIGVVVGSGIGEKVVVMEGECQGIEWELGLWTGISVVDCARHPERSREVARNRDKRMFSCIVGPLQSAFRGWLMTMRRNVFFESDNHVVCMTSLLNFGAPIYGDLGESYITGREKWSRAPAGRRALYIVKRSSF